MLYQGLVYTVYSVIGHIAFVACIRVLLKWKLSSEIVVHRNKNVWSFKGQFTPP